MKADNASLKSPWAYCAQHDQANAPVYRYGRIRSIKSLELALGMPEQALRALAKRASSMYFVAKRVPKEDGALRILFDTRQPLKKILQRVNSQFLKRVCYPPYLTGGVPGKDYTWSAKLHANAPLVIKEDIRKFFPSVSTEVVFDIWHRFFWLFAGRGRIAHSAYDAKWPPRTRISNQWISGEFSPLGCRAQSGIPPSAKMRNYQILQTR